MRWSPLVHFDWNNLNADSLNSNLVEAIRQAAEKTDMQLTTTSGHRNNFPSKPWFDTDCRNMKYLLAQLHSTCRSHSFSGASSNNIFHQHKRDYQKLITTKKQEYKKKITIDSTMVSDVTKSWSVVRSVKCIATFTPLLPNQTWDRFYSQVYPPRNIVTFHATLTNDAPDQPLSYQEATKWLRRLKNGKH